jgi:hypothetical protein
MVIIVEIHWYICIACFLDLPKEANILNNELDIPEEQSGKYNILPFIE